MNDYKRYTTTCENGCGKEATYTTKGTGKHLCSRIPAKCDVKLKKMKDTCVERYGSTNPSGAESVKSQKKRTFMERYGVETSLQLPAVRQASKEALESRQERIREELSTISDAPMISQEEYFSLVTKITHRSYTKHIDEIDPLRLRGESYHLDHRVSKLEGYLNNIPPQIIGDVSNLEIIPASTNMSKLHHSSITISELYESYNQRYESSHKPNLEEALSRQKIKAPYHLVDDVGTCQYCNEEARYKSLSGQWCCSEYHNSCSAMKKKNSTNQIKSEKKRQATKDKVARLKTK